MDFPSSDSSLSNLSNLSIVLHPDLSLHEGQFVGNLLLDEIRHRSIGRAFRPRSHQGVHRYIMDRTSSLQSPVHSSPPGYQIKATWIWWIPGGFGNCTRSCLDTSGVLTFSIIFVPKLPVLLWFPFLPRQLISPWNSQNLGNAWRAMPL